MDWREGQSCVENMAPVSKLLKSINSPARIYSRRHAGTGGWVQGASRLDPESEETGSAGVIWVEVVGGITVLAAYSVE